MSNKITVRNVVFDFSENDLKIIYNQICVDYIEKVSRLLSLLNKLLMIVIVFLIIAVMSVMQNKTDLSFIVFVLSVTIFSVLWATIDNVRTWLEKLRLARFMCVGIGDGFENSMSTVKGLCNLLKSSLWHATELKLLDTIWYMYESYKDGDTIVMDSTHPVIDIPNRDWHICLKVEDDSIDYNNATIHISVDDIKLL
jgi:hypothetical protein